MTSLTKRAVKLEGLVPFCLKQKTPVSKTGAICAQINGWGSQDRTGASGSRDRRPTSGPIPNKNNYHSSQAPLTMSRNTNILR